MNCAVASSGRLSLLKSKNTPMVIAMTKAAATAPPRIRNSRLLMMHLPDDQTHTRDTKRQHIKALLHRKGTELDLG